MTEDKYLRAQRMMVSFFKIPYEYGDMTAQEFAELWQAQIKELNDIMRDEVIDDRTARRILQDMLDVHGKPDEHTKSELTVPLDSIGYLISYISYLEHRLKGIAD